MMRTRIAFALVCGVVLLVIGLAVRFAGVGTEGGRQPSDPPTTAGTDTLPRIDGARERGQAIFEAQGCASCHSIGAIGNPRYPLDRVGAKRDDISIREWILAEGTARDSLSSTVRRSKTGYREMSPSDLGILVQYLTTLRTIRIR